MIGTMPKLVGTDSVLSVCVRLPLLGWTYVAAVATLAAVSAFGHSLAAYLVLIVITLPVGAVAQLTNLTLVFGAAELLGLNPEVNYPLLGVLTVFVWTVSGWANAQLLHACWRCACDWLAARRTRRQHA